MGHRRKRRSFATEVSSTTTKRVTEEECGPQWCEHGGRCVRTAGGGAACVCTDTYGGPRCHRYVGHDHPCLALSCAAPQLCVWPSPAHAVKGASEAAFCACPEGSACASTGPHVLSARTGGGTAVVATVAAASGGGGAAWAGGVLGALGVAALALVLAVLFLRRRRQGLFVHARLADNVEISNPMYLAGDDDEPAGALPPPHHRTNGGTHFANPVYDSLYAGAPPRDLADDAEVMRR